MTTTPPFLSEAASGLPLTPVSPHPVGFWRGAWSIAALELRRRVRSHTLLVLAIVWFVITTVVAIITWLALSSNAEAYGVSFDAYPIFGIIVSFVLLFGSLVAPAISGNAINSERAAATLATTQVTLVGSWSIILGKYLASWLTGLAFLGLAVPALVLSIVFGAARPEQFTVAILALVLQLGFFTAVGVALSALIASPLFSIVTTYLVVALFSVGTLIAFGLGSAVATTYQDVEVRQYTQAYWEAQEECTTDECYEAIPQECETVIETMPVSGATRSWWLLVPNPYVVLADMVPPRLEYDYTSDIFSAVSGGVRSLQSQQVTEGWNDCTGDYPYDVSYSDSLRNSTPVWWWGLGIQILLAAGLLWWGKRRIATPARTIPGGSRIA